MEEGEEEDGQRYNDDRVALSPGGEALASGTGVGDRVHERGGGGNAACEGRSGSSVGSEPSVLFVRLVPNKQTEQFNTYGPSSRDVNVRRNEADAGGKG